MGRYLKLSNETGKADELIQSHGAQEVDLPESFEDKPLGKEFVAVVSNPGFDAAAWCFDDIEFGRLNVPSDSRPVTWLVMDREAILEML